MHYGNIGLAGKLNDKLARFRRGEEGRYTSLTLQPKADHFNSSVKLKSSLKKKGLVLTLNLRPKGIILPFKDNHTSTTESSLRSDSTTVTGIKPTLSSPPSVKAFRIVDKLSQLTSIKLKNALLPRPESSYGFRNIQTPGVDIKIPKISTSNATSSKIANLKNIISSNFNKNVSSIHSIILTINSTTSKPSTSTSQVPETASTESQYAIAAPLISSDSRNSTSLKSKVGGYLQASDTGNGGSSSSGQDSGSKTFKDSGSKTVQDSGSKTVKDSGSKTAKDSGSKKNSNRTLEDHEHLKEESRVITADQIGGNRPTQVPFHFTTTIAPPTTTRSLHTPPPNRYQKVHSPHNHIYAPTQDPLNIAHGEDVSGEDLEDFHAAHVNFGSKVGADGATTPSTRSNTQRPPPVYDISGNRLPVLPVRSLQSNQNSNSNKSPRSESKSPAPAANILYSASSGKNPQRQKTNNINEQLPFYKEQGGVFEHPKYSHSEQNEIPFHDKVSGVTYAPKGPAAQSQTNVYSTPKHAPAVQIVQPPAPQYVQVQQQPIYLAPVPVQQVVQPYNPNPIPQNNYYQQPVAALPVQVPTYYPAPAPHQHSPQHHHHPSPHHQHSSPHHQHSSPHHQHSSPHHQHSHHPAPVQASSFGNQNGGFVPVQQHHQPQHSPPQYSHSPRHSQPTKELYTPPSDNRNPYYHEHGRPPPREDPESDTFYGSPIAAPPKPQASKPRPAEKVSSRPKPTSPRRQYEEQPSRDKDYDDRGDYEPARPPPPLPPPPARRGPDHYPSQPRRHPSPPSRGRYNDDYDSDPNENIDEVVAPNGRRPAANNRQYEEDDDHPAPPAFYQPSADDYRFGRRPNNSPNFDHPNIFFDNDRNPDRGGGGGGGGRGHDHGHGNPGGPPGHPGGPHGNRRPDERQPSNNNFRRDEPRGSNNFNGDEPRSNNFNGDDGDDYLDRAPVQQSIERNLPVLDPIYTRTIKQYDEEQRRRPEQQSSTREPEEDHNDGGFEDGNQNNEPRQRYPSNQNSQRHPPQRQPQQQHHPDEEEDDGGDRHHDDRGGGRGDDRGGHRGGRQGGDERDDRREDDGGEREEEEDDREESKPTSRRPQQQQQREEEPAEEEEEEETQQAPTKQQSSQEEEEEEEEEPEKPQKQERGQKKKPPKKPKDEKTGNLDDDIAGIERDFGSNFGFNGGNSGAPPPSNVQYHPVLG